MKMLLLPAAFLLTTLWTALRAADTPGVKPMIGTLPAAKVLFPGQQAASWPDRLIGYSVLRTDLSGGRHMNIRTMRARVVQADGTGSREVAAELATDADTSTQFAGWSPDGATAIVHRNWKSPENAAWEEEHKTFRFTKEGCLLDAWFVDLPTGKTQNITAAERVSFYNSGVFFWPGDSAKLGFTALIDGNSHPFRMDRDGRNKTDLTKGSQEFTYGFSSSRDGRRIAYHKNFVMRLVDRAEKRITDLTPGHAAMWPHWQPRTGDGLAVMHRGEARTEVAPHGDGNVYAPEVQSDGKRWVMWYGGQGQDGHDRIHRAESADGRSWTGRGVVLDAGTANHVNDPSVVRTGDRWWMFYTVAQNAEEDEIAAAISSDGVTWEKRGVVLTRGEGKVWDSAKVGRPSVLHEGGVFRMWFDGQPTPEVTASNPLAAAVRREGRAIGYAESTDGLHWQRRPEPVFREGAGAVHVSRQGSRLIMVIESGQGVKWAASPDGLAWHSRGFLLPLSGSAVDRFGQVTPFLCVLHGQATVFFGAAARKTWDGNVLVSAPVHLSD